MYVHYFGEKNCFQYGPEPWSTYILDVYGFKITVTQISQCNQMSNNNNTIYEFI